MAIFRGAGATGTGGESDLAALAQDAIDAAAEAAQFADEAAASAVDAADASRLTVGTVTTGLAGSNASVTITGAAGEQVIDFTIPRGNTGATGPQGEQGIQGLKGDKGDTGDTGPQGIQGIQGETGPQGIQGIQGETGPQGEQGIQGIQGIQGETGPKGDTGDTGNGIDNITRTSGDGSPGTTDTYTVTYTDTTTDTFTVYNGANGEGAGSVTSVDMTVPTGLSVSGNPITSSGTLAVTLASGYSIPTTAKQTEWNTAYTWGDHASAGYLTSYTETDPVFTASPAAGITTTNITNWDTAYGWGDHSTAGYADAGDNFDITSMSGITGGITTPDYVTFDTTPETTPTAEGSLYWDSADGAQTLSLIMAGGNVTQQIGEEQYFRIKASAAITNGQVVMFTGTVGASGALTGAPATGLAANTASYVMGIATEDIALNGWGYVTSFGLVRDLNTEAYTDGAILYLDPTVAGGLTATVPTAPAPKVQVCACVHAATNGSLFVRTTFGGTLGQYEGDVNISSPISGQVLKYNGTAWVNTAETDPVYTASSWYTTTNNANNWDTAYGWGNHASAGYADAGTNSDITSLSGITGGISTADYVDLDTAATPSAVVGRLSWDDGNGTANITLKGGNTNLAVGQELVARVYNDSGSALTDGQIVYISGAQGNRIAVKLANAASEATSAGTLGMVTEPIASGAEGFITIMGTVNGLNTIGLTAGNLIYLSASTAGAYTTTAPTAPNHRVILGYVERVHATVGSIYVKVDNGYELDELHNVLITTPSTNQVLKYDGSKWVNGAETDPVYTASSWYTTTNNATNWNTAYGWGNHASAGYLTGTVAIANGGTGQTSASAAFNALSPITSTGDLILGNGVNSATRLAIGTSGQVLTSNGTTAVWQAASGGGGSLLRQTVFTASGTWTKGTNTKYVLVQAVGGGGGGGRYTSGSCGGGAGGFSQKLIDVSAINTVSVTIGAGGTGATTNGNGTNGGNTTFGTHVTCNGGGGGAYRYQDQTANGGTASGGDVNIKGGNGAINDLQAGNYTNLSGVGGASYFGGGGYGSTASNSTAGVNGQAYGSGGGGGSNSNGGDGASGIIIVQEFA